MSEPPAPARGLAPVSTDGSTGSAGPGARREMAAAQHRLLGSILAGDGWPQAFDRSRLEVARDAVVVKRAWCVSGSWPLMAGALRGDYFELFTQFVSDHPSPHPSGALADGRLFAAWLAERGRVPDIARIQMLSFDLHYRLAGTESRERRGPAVRLARISAPPYLIIGVKLPAAEARVFRVPLSRRRMKK